MGTLGYAIDIIYNFIFLRIADMLISRFYGHFWTSFKRCFWLIIALGMVGGLTAGLASSSYGIGEGAITVIGIFTSVIIMFMVAIKSHLTPIQNEQPDIVSIIDGRINRGRFIKVFILVTLATAVPIIFNIIVSADLISIGGLQLRPGMHSDVIPQVVIVVLFGGLTAFILVALSPFIPRALSDLIMPIKDQIAVNLSNWQRALLYIVVFAFIPHFVLSSLTTALLFWVMISVLGVGEMFVFLMGGVMFITTALNGVSVVLLSTAFSLHFLDTVADEAVENIPDL
jgi:hypothetical protein